MGISESFPEEPPQTIEERIQKSKQLLDSRIKRKQTYKQMIKRVISQPQPAFALLTLPEPAFLLIVKFLSNEINSLMSVSAYCHYRVLQVLDSAFSPIESHFALVHSPLLAFKKSYMNVSKIQVSNREGIRADRVIVAQALKPLAGHTIKLRFTYRNYLSPNIFKAEFKFDCTNKKKQSVWAHRDQCRFHGQDTKQAYTQQIPSVIIGDDFEISINWYNLIGLARLESVQWQPPLVQETKLILKSLQLGPEFSRKKHDQTEGIQQKLYLYNIARHCEVELSQIQWYDARYYAKPRTVAVMNCFEPFLKLVKSEFAGVDMTVSKNTYKAMMCGIVPESLGQFGIQVEVRQDVTHEVKRLGLLYDRGRPVQLRLGDEFVFYVSRGGQVIFYDKNK